MSATLTSHDYVQTILADAALAASKVAAIASAIQKSPITAEMERLVPGIVKIVADLTPIAGYANALADILPIAQQFVAITGARSATVDEMTALTRDKGADFPG